MSHYYCKGCHQLDCICPKSPPRIIPDDGKHWKSKYLDGRQVCINCGGTYFEHVMNHDLCARPMPGEVWQWTLRQLGL